MMAASLNLTRVKLLKVFGKQLRQLVEPIKDSLKNLLIR